MKIWVIALGNRLPAWAESASEDFLKRFPSDWRVHVKALKTPAREGQPPERLMQLEAQKIEEALPKDAWVVVLDERGATLTTSELSRRFERWKDMGKDIVFVIGGPDGIDEALKAKAHDTIRLSSMTWPHAMVRVMLLEQLYRVFSLQTGHPYHRE
jgi:23S rRNA (pseudouridine1915-N3)-methyltransferase